ncbi:MarR family winged helix-turn-helix transcriptional regulator [Alkalicoccus daliensis]|uniref:MarR family transcriptional regulator, 2-MHQ and catechol-resistance regulon repressor n=1 Tax=Alkalicoccus daliensis TaxID=745820 RepID=A0A1H0AYR8_9BACI|nr:MarR family transcriptional regulator [Alkalicoccus daliensis]SDN38558.1 MarR family transcriptional regulator, 2-MHQ and catechol-resistance regulon repressor [Alkalicoccus daliensis]
MNKEEQESLKLFVVFSRAYAAVHKEAEKDMKSYGLNPTEFAVLELIYHKGEQPIQKIGEKVLIASSSITYVVDKLEGKEYLVRKASKYDRRITLADITNKGREFMDEIFPKHRAFINGLMEPLSKDEKKQMLTLLKKMGYHAEK